MQDRLLHEGESRPRPVYFVVRFVASPWSTQATREAPNSIFSDFLGVTGASAVKLGNTYLRQESSEKEWNNLSLVGIGDDELWILVKVDPVAYLGTPPHNQSFDMEGGIVGTESKLIHQVR